MVNKRGFLRVVEATIAILIILTVLVFLSAQRSQRTDSKPGEKIPMLLDEIARNLSFREELTAESDEEITEKAIERELYEKLKNPSINISVELCDTNETCFLKPYPDIDEDIFSYERVVSASIVKEEFVPKRIKVFLWRNTV